MSCSRKSPQACSTSYSCQAECCDQALGEPGLGDPGKVRLRQRTWLADGVWAKIVEILGEEGGSTPVLSHGTAPALSISSGPVAEPQPSISLGARVVNPVRIS